MSNIIHAGTCCGQLSRDWWGFFSSIFEDLEDFLNPKGWPDLIYDILLQKFHLMRFGGFFLIQSACEDKPQVVPAWYKVEWYIVFDGHIVLECRSYFQSLSNSFNLETQLSFSLKIISLQRWHADKIVGMWKASAPPELPPPSYWYFSANIDHIGSPAILTRRNTFVL